mgnify:CR=1 FL=1
MNHKTLLIAKDNIYRPSQLLISNYKENEESQDYEACTFTLANKKIIYRAAKITPTKVGHFVTVWKRKEGITAPFEESDTFDYFIISVEDQEHFGQFIFDKKTLVKHGIITSSKKPGKRGMRVYAPWIIPNNKTALNTQKWQCDCFIDFNDKPEKIMAQLHLMLSKRDL